MRGSIEFLLGLLDGEECPRVAQEDWDGEHGPTLRIAQEMGLIEKEPGANPVASCPHCEDGVPYTLGGRLLCNRCYSTVDPRHLLLWPVDLTALLRWIAAQWGLLGGVRRIDARLWQLGTSKITGGVYECFYRRRGPLSGAGRERLAAFRQALVLCGSALPDAAETLRRPHLCLVELLRCDGALSLADPSVLIRPHGEVRFHAGIGALWAGRSLLGEVPVGSREYHLLDCLARRIDAFVPYQDLKAHVLRASGSTDSTEEATFCQILKSRIKKKYIAGIDRVLVASNRGDGYRLRGYVEAS